MKLTNYTDYSLRVLIYLALKKPGELANITEIAEAYSISRNHLTKVIHELGKMGVIHTIRGRRGGIKLALPPEEINIGEVVRKTEDDFNIVECFGDGPSRCVISPICGLKHVLNSALSAYLAVLDEYTLADIVKSPFDYRALLGMEQ
ncbi:MAG TPA: Rrf2 family transcriptional regulator [Bacillus bacterium]|uniref:HTH-type transcriptional regulator NsrR n=1 Tax=Siminovitchia fordii TaxID=254759 RepID=A0ABQ4KBW5_9BACI|nr:Rrf2 family transcriptional regulator [Siminovitchia fordii]GIN23224.1 HTH-type transcriptional regulator NsrR [Siminovitchia fordii]HBZ11218.1 Rrf2 family transcriptional regulator [Bacillus sp. (in: firmicutes)]